MYQTDESSISDDEKSEELNKIKDEFKRQIITEYEQDKRDHTSMKRAIRDAEIALMPSKQRFQFAHDRMQQRRQQLDKELQKILHQYRDCIRSCPLEFHDAGEVVLSSTFPYLVLPYYTGKKILTQIHESVVQRLIQKYGTKNQKFIEELSSVWLQASLQYLGFTRNSVPHPDVISCIVPNVC